MKRRNFIQKGLGTMALGSAAFGMRNSRFTPDVLAQPISSLENIELTDKELPKINTHGHLRKHHNIPERIKIWDQWNVQHFCCLCLNDDITWNTDHGYFNNEDFLKIKDEYGERILGFAAVRATRKRVSSAKDIERFKDQGFVGLKFCDAGYPYDHDILFPVYEKAQELGMPIVFHTGHLSVGYAAEERELGIEVDNMRVMTLDKVARWFPDLNIIAAHLGVQNRNEALEQLRYYKNFHCDFCGGGGSVSWVRSILDSMLPPAGLDTDMSNLAENQALVWFKKLCFGTDNPEPDTWVPNSQYIMDRLEIPLETRKLFYYETAAKLLGL
ncbi:MAG: amidohydrolase family protein [Bacteroidota bacterium]